MNPHRLNTFDLDHEAVPPPRSAAAAGNFVTRYIVVLLGTVACTAGVAMLIRKAEAEVTPIVAPQIEERAMLPLDVETAIAQARVDSWRSGFAHAVEQGCAPLKLQRPIATR